MKISRLYELVEEDVLLDLRVLKNGLTHNMTFAYHDDETGMWYVFRLNVKKVKRDNRYINFHYNVDEFCYTDADFCEVVYDTIRQEWDFELFKDDSMWFTAESVYYEEAIADVDRQSSRYAKILREELVSEIRKYVVGHEYVDLHCSYQNDRTPGYLCGFHNEIPIWVVNGIFWEQNTPKLEDFTFGNLECIVESIGKSAKDYDLYGDIRFGIKEAIPVDEWDEF